MEIETVCLTFIEEYMGKKGRYFLSVALFSSLIFVFIFILTTANPPTQRHVAYQRYTNISDS